LLDNTTLLCNIGKDIFSVLGSTLALYEIYLMYPMGVHGPPVKNCCCEGMK
jgi:hypothetical protein